MDLLMITDENKSNYVYIKDFIAIIGVVDCGVHPNKHL